MPIRTNVHSLVLGAAIAAALAVVMAQLGIGRDTADARPDLLLAVRMAVLYAAIFMAGHLGLRRFLIGSPLAYGALGAAAGGAAALLAFGPSATALEPSLLAAAFCVVTGTLYRLHATYAGRDWQEAFAR